MKRKALIEELVWFPDTKTVCPSEGATTIVYTTDGYILYAEAREDGWFDPGGELIEDVLFWAAPLGPVA